MVVGILIGIYGILVCVFCLLNGIVGYLKTGNFAFGISIRYDIFGIVYFVLAFVLKTQSWLKGLPFKEAL